MFELLGELELDWDRVDLLQVDERVAPDGDPDRNLTHIGESLPDAAVARLRPMPVTEEDLDAAAARYEAELPKPLDLVHLGIGPDGHTASLVPDDPVLEVTDRLVAVTGGGPGTRRRAQGLLARRRGGQARRAREAARSRPLRPGGTGRGVRRDCSRRWCRDGLVSVAVPFRFSVVGLRTRGYPGNRMERTAWTDDRLDDLTRRMDAGFDRVDANFNRVDADIRELRGEIGMLRTTLVRVGGGIMAGLVGVIAAVLVGG